MTTSKLTAYKQSFTEIHYLLKHCNKDIIEKLPRSFINIVDQNMDKTYTPNINYNQNICNQNLKKETQIIISLIYRDYLCNEEEKQKIIKNDINEIDKINSKMSELYNIDTIFKQKNSDIKNTSIDSSKNEICNLPVKLKKDNWFTKLLKIFNFKK